METPDKIHTFEIMKGRGNPINRRENILSVWLYDAGYSRKEIAKLLKVRYARTEQVLKNPELLTGWQYQLIANALELPIIDVLRAIFYNNQTPKKRPQLWHEEQPTYGKE